MGLDEGDPEAGTGPEGPESRPAGGRTSRGIDDFPSATTRTAGGRTDGRSVARRKDAPPAPPDEALVALRKEVGHLRAVVGVLIVWSAGVSVYAFTSTRESQRMLCLLGDYERLLGEDCRTFYSGSLLAQTLTFGAVALILGALALYFLLRPRAVP